MEEGGAFPRDPPADEAKFREVWLEGVTGVYVGEVESNPSRRLYEELGFEAAGRVPEAIKGEDAIVYWRKL